MLNHDKLTWKNHNLNSDSNRILSWIIKKKDKTWLTNSFQMVRSTLKKIKYNKIILFLNKKQTKIIRTKTFFVEETKIKI